MCSEWIDLEAELRRRIPAEFLRATVATIVEANRLSDRAFEGMHPQWRRGAFGHMRREQLNQLLDPVARGFGARTRRALNGNNSSCHLEIEFSDLVLTASAVDSPGEFPEDADYRKTLARSSQASMFDKLGLEPEATGGAALYAVLTYSRTFDAKTFRPSFVTIGFPDQKNDHFVALVSLREFLDELASGTGPSADDLAENTDQESEKFPEEKTESDDLDLKFIGKRKPTKENQR